MQRCYSTILRAATCVGLLAASAYASDVKDETQPTPGDPWVGIQTNCDLTNYKVGVQVFTPPVAIPDNQPANPVTVGPITVADDGTLIGDVIIDVSWAHTWIGDITATVGYDENCDGAIDAQSVIVCRPGDVPCTGTAVGCSSNFICANTYLFDDAAAVSLPTTGCSSATNVAGGCYLPTGSGASPLSVFEGHRKGGCWYLKVSDSAAADTGTICSWSVHILNQPPIATTAKSWGGVKVLFN